MNGMNLQRGAGLVEVLVALLLLSIGVLGFATLQLRAVDASQVAGSQVTAVSVASDLADRMRVNLPAVWDGCYQKSKQTACAQSTTPSDVQATSDIQDVNQKAVTAGMTAVVVDLCPQSISTINANVTASSATRQCVYVGWGKTTLSNGKYDCIDSSSGNYNPGAQCLFLEAY